MAHNHALNSFDSLFVEQLKDMYSAEKQVAKALPKMLRSASSEELRQALSEHQQQTQRQIERLEHIFQILNQKPGRPKCAGMEGILTEGEELLRQKGDPAVKDAALIASAQRVEHYEIAGYGTVRSFAEMLGKDEAARILQETLDEERQTDRRLTELAMTGVNVEALERESRTTSW